MNEGRVLYEADIVMPAGNTSKCRLLEESAARERHWRNDKIHQMAQELTERKKSDD